MQDPETGEQYAVNTNDKALRAAHSNAMRIHTVEWDRTFTQLGIDQLSLLTNHDFVTDLRKLFARRSRMFTR